MSIVAAFVLLALVAALVVVAVMLIRRAELAEAEAERLHARVGRLEARAEAASVLETRLGRALGAIPQGVVICDEAGHVVFRNEAASGFFAARHSEALVEAAIDDLLAGAVHGRTDTRSLDLYGPPRRALDLLAVPIEGGSSGALIVVQDVSERRRLDAVRRDFVANISHELKTPVGALGLLAETLLDETDPEIVRRLSARMVSEALRVGRTIDDLLELSRIEARELPSREPVPVFLALAEARDRMLPAAEQRGVRIEVVEPSRHLTVLGDRRQLVSALSNLLDNAVKYSDPGSDVHLFATTDGTTVDLVVEDRGIGIPAADLERVFERFYRVDRARSRDTGGTGLGLAIVRHVAGNHDGEVTVTSREGQGSTFTLRLPAGPRPVVRTERGKAAG
jgi:two-component system sensor histidine kinase SenX3